MKETTGIKRIYMRLFLIVFCIIIQVSTVQSVFAAGWCVRCNFSAREYGMHISNTHSIYQKCSVCGYLGRLSGTGKRQDCNLCYISPTLSLMNLSANTTLGKNDIDFKLQIAVSQNENRVLKCIYVLNEEEEQPPIYQPYSYNSNDGLTEKNNLEVSNNKIPLEGGTLEPYIPDNTSDPEIVYDTREVKIVTFKDGIDARKLKQGLNKITVKVQIVDNLPGETIYGYAKVVSSYFNVDFGAPVIKRCTASSTQNSISISVVADSESLPIEYRYSVGSNVSSWLSGQNSYTLNELAPNTSYTYKVEAKDSRGNISSPFVGTIDTKPQAPVINAQAGNNNSIKINILDNNPPDSLYRIKVGNKFLSNDGELSSPTLPTWISIPTKTITAIDLDGNTQYKIVVYFKYKGVNEVASEELNIKTTPLAPKGLKCTSRTKNSINLVWDTSPGAYVYDILRETVVNGSVVETKLLDNIMISSYSDTGLLENQLYRYKIRAKSDLNTYGNWSETTLDIATMPKEPLKIEGLKSELQPSKIVLSWNPQTEAIGYEILINQHQKYYSLTNEIDIPFTEANAQYLMSVRAFNVCDASNPQDTAKWSNPGEWSEPLISYTSSNAPKNIEIKNITFDKVQFMWDKNNNPDSVLYKCSIYKENTCIYESNEISANTYSFSDLEAQTQYTVKIYSINSSGIKSYETAQSEFTTKIAPPEAPKRLISSAKDKEITLSWDKSERAQSYTVKRDGLIIADNIQDNKFFDKELIPDTVYTYEIIALNESGEAVAQIVQKTKVQAPSIPSGIEFTRNNTHIQISWDDSEGAEGYDIKCDGKIYNTELNTYFEHDGLNPGTVHTYSIRSRNTYSKSEWSEPITVTTIPKAPVVPDEIELTASQTKIYIKWEAVNGADSYIVNIDDIEIKDIKIPGYTYSFENSSEEEHIIKIMAVNEGGESGYTAPKRIKLLPGEDNIPELTGKIEEQAILISWNKLENALSYEIEIDNVISVTASAITAEHIDVVSDLTQAHTYRVRALFDGAIGSWSYPLTIKSIPAVPSQLLCIPGQNTITLRWNKCDTAVTYELAADGTTIYIGPNTEFIHSSLPDNSSRVYSVRAVNGSGYSEWSEDVSATTNREITDIPQNIKPSNNKEIIIVSWDSVKDAEGYIVKINDGQVQYVNVPMISISVTPQAFYAVSVAAVFDYENNVSGEWSPEVVFSGPPAIPQSPVIKEINAAEFSVELIWDNISYAEGYEVEIDGGKISKTYINRYFDSDVSPKTTKSYRIRSYNESGESSWSEIIYVTTDETLPGAPINLLCKNSVSTSGSAISIKWNAVEDAVSYEVTDSENNIYTCESPEIVLAGLKGGTLYQFKVRALTNAGQGPWSSIAYCVTDISTPKNLTVSNDEQGGIKLVWDKSDSASLYEIEADGLIMASTEDNKITLKLSDYMTHSFRIRALNEIKTGEWTEELKYNSDVPVNVDVEEDEELSVTMPVSNIKDIGSYKMTIIINTDELGLVDACEFTPEKELSTSYIKNNNMQIIIENRDNFCYITILIKNESTDKTSGIINSIRLIGKKKCLSEIRYIVDKLY